MYIFSPPLTAFYNNTSFQLHLLLSGNTGIVNSTYTGPFKEWQVKDISCVKEEIDNWKVSDDQRR